MVTNTINEWMLLVRARTVPTEYILDIVLVATKNSDNFSKSRSEMRQRETCLLHVLHAVVLGLGFRMVHMLRQQNWLGV